MALLLFPGMPGAVELLVILVMMGLFLVVPLALIVAAYLFGKRRGKAEVSESGES
ncbi:hypothetical protein [Haloarcula amylolytica]|jgi:hypothetical protein|uniref:hypothetical protein n=1 Tax=Haloarcula amylolytica TaxID=396317 RepID=UPI003C76490B